LKVGIVGDEQSGKKLVSHLEEAGIHADFVAASIQKLLTSFFRLKDYDIIHGLYIRPFVFLSLILGKILGKITICHWMGSDVMRVLKDTRFRLMALIFNSFIDLNIAFWENLKEELKYIGIESVVWPIPVDIEYFSMDKLPHMPKNFSVLCKIADDWLYGSGAVFKLAKDFPNVRFLVVSGKYEQPSWLLSKIDEAPNIVFLGWKNNMREIYRQSTVLLRLTKHDGLSYMVIESLAMGRQVIWSHNFLPYCRYVESYNEAKEAILRIQKDPKLNMDGAEYVRKNFSAKFIIRKLIKTYNGLISKKYLKSSTLNLNNKNTSIRLLQRLKRDADLL